MKIYRLNSIAAGAALCLLAACGQDPATQNEASLDDSESSASQVPANRDWIPAGLVLPEPNTIIREGPMGSRTNILQVSVPNDPSDRFPAWTSALETAGYDVNDSMLPDGRLVFTGLEVESGQIAVLQTEDVEGYVIQIDVSQNAQ